MNEFKNKMANDVINAMEHRMASLIMILGRMCLSALNTRREECSEEELDKIMSNVSEVQSELCMILEIPKDTLVDAMITVNKLLNTQIDGDDKIDETFINELKSIAYTPGGKS